MEVDDPGNQIVVGKAKGKKKTPKGGSGKQPKPGAAGKRSAPVKGDHSIAVAAPEVAGIDGGGRPGHRREGSIGNSGGTGLPSGAKHSRSTPSPTATRRKGTPSPSQLNSKGGRSGSPSPRAGQPMQPPTAAGAASRSPSPGMPGSPSPPAPDTAMGNDGRRTAGKSPTSAVWRGGVAADSSGASKRRATRGHTVAGGARGMVTGGASTRKPVTSKSKAPMSKSFDEHDARNMQAIKNAFNMAPHSRGQSQIPSAAMQSAPSVDGVNGDMEDDASEDFVLDEELCSLHEESIHGEDDDEMAGIDTLSGDHSAHSFTSGSALGTGAFLPVGKAHVTSMAGLEEWVAEAAEQKMMPVPQGKQRLDEYVKKQPPSQHDTQGCALEIACGCSLLSESEHYPSKNPEEIQIHPDMIGCNIWNRMKALEKLVELQRKHSFCLWSQGCCLRNCLCWQVMPRSLMLAGRWCRHCRQPAVLKSDGCRP